MNGQPLISIDVVALRRAFGGGVEFALHRRPYEPYAGRFALPGVLLSPGERIEDAAYRALSAKLMIDRERTRYLSQCAVSDETNRDPRGATISIVFLAMTDADEDAAQWFRLWEDEVPDLPFDHNGILDSALNAAKSRLWSDWAFTRAILGDAFATSDARAVGAALDHLPTDASNLYRWLKSSGKVVASDDRTGLRGRDTRWEWA